MADGISVALSGAIAQATSLDTTAGNLANASTDSGDDISRPRDPSSARPSRGQTQESRASTTPRWRPRLDTTPGALRDTGQPLDIAMPQGTYLSVSTAAGDRYTRTASMCHPRQGARATSHGDPVLGDNEAIRATRAIDPEPGSTTPASFGRATRFAPAWAS